MSRDLPPPARPGEVLLLDGGLATELETRGADLSDALWSARLLLDDPARIRAAHRAYLEAGADVLITASYQASARGFAARGLDAAASAALLRRSVALAREARAAFLATPDGAARRRPLVAASVGPYGAVLADGSEYRGDYGLGAAELAAFHRPRLEVLAAAGADWLALETIPCLAEAAVLVALLEALPADAPPAWLSFACRDGARLASGEPFAEAAALAAGSPRVFAFGVNCCPPAAVAPLLARAGAISPKPLLAYPNRGDTWDPEARRWVGGSGARGAELAEMAPRWVAAGARLVGGCCRVGPPEIAAIAAARPFEAGLPV